MYNLLRERWCKSQFGDKGCRKSNSASGDVEIIACVLSDLLPAGEQRRLCFCSCSFREQLCAMYPTCSVPSSCQATTGAVTGWWFQARKVISPDKCRSLPNVVRWRKVPSFDLMHFHGFMAQVETCSSPFPTASPLCCTWKDHVHTRTVYVRLCVVSELIYRRGGPPAKHAFRSSGNKH